jgi:hypothetical protein
MATETRNYLNPTEFEAKSATNITITGLFVKQVSNGMATFPGFVAKKAPGFTPGHYFLKAVTNGLPTVSSFTG